MSSIRRGRGAARWRNLRIRTKLGLAFAGISVLVVGVAVGGVLAIGQQRDLAQKIARVDVVAADAETMKFQIADATGWQGLYVADVAAFGPAAGLSDKDFNRAGLLQNKRDTYAWLDSVDTSGMTPAELAQFAKLRPAWDDFFRWDDQVVAWIRPGTRAGLATALKSVNGGDAGAAYNTILDAAQAVGKSATARKAALVHQQSTAQTRATALLWVAGGLGVGLAALLAWSVTRTLVRPLDRVRGVAEALARGDLTASSGLSSRDEAGRVAAALDAAQQSLREVLSSVVASADAVAASSEELSASAAQISASAEETSAQSGVVAGAAQEVSRSVQTVAAGTEQMGASIREIAANATEASEVATRAVDAATATSATIAKLGDSSAEIGNVVKVITSIAEQTNLLALNATIEAARAGEAGKGFAVVANEVKELAQETAKATEDIARRVQAIQADTGAAVTAIGEISDIVARISDRQSTIASAVEEQTATTTEMARSVAEAATGSHEIAGNITGISTAAGSTTQALGQTRSAVGELSRMAADLRTAVGRFSF
jgi:methyl-accepting chemotaxis protein